jgi:hypothetical protein
MGRNYKKVAGVELGEWPEDAEEPAEQRHCKLEEMYYEPYSGDLVVRFIDRDTNRTFDLSIPVKADENWNDFADSLPRWDND